MITLKYIILSTRIVKIEHVPTHSYSFTDDQNKEIKILKPGNGFFIFPPK